MLVNRLIGNELQLSYDNTSLHFFGHIGYFSGILLTTALTILFYCLLCAVCPDYLFPFQVGKYCLCSGSAFDSFILNRKLRNN